MKPKILKIIAIVAFSLSLTSLIVGASFHGYRMNVEDLAKYNLGVTMGIIMISLFATFLAPGIVALIFYKRKK